MVYMAMARSLSASVQNLWSICVNEPAKPAHAFKMGLALLIIFLLVLLDAPYQWLGERAIWAIMTVVVVFEFSIGATISKGLNRGLGTVVAAILATAVGELADILVSSGLLEPISVAVTVFIVGGCATFIKFTWSAVKTYEYSFQTFLLTFCLITVAEYLEDNPLETSFHRFLVILMGGLVGFVVNVFVLPCWSGQDLYRNIVKNFYCVAESLEACVDEYIKGVNYERFPSMGLPVNDPIYKAYRSTLSSATQEESLANFASWEPPHGRFWLIKYPWHSYAKVGAVLRHCAYSVVALHGCLQSAIQAPLKVRNLFEDELRDVGVQAALVLRTLARQIEDMHKRDSTTILCGVQHAVDRLQQSLYLKSFLLVSHENGTFGNAVEDVAVSVIPEMRRSNSHRAIPSSEGYTDFEINQCQHLESDESLMVRQRLRKLHSWPSRPMEELDFGEALIKHSVKVLDSASALSVGTFATLLMEVAHRLDYVVEAVDELAALARFTEIEDKVDVVGSSA